MFSNFFQFVFENRFKKRGKNLLPNMEHMVVSGLIHKFVILIYFLSFKKIAFHYRQDVFNYKIILNLYLTVSEVNLLSTFSTAQVCIKLK